MKPLLLKVYTLILTVLLIIIIGSFLVINQNVFGSKEILYKKYPNLSKKFSRNLFNSKSLINNLENDYNVKFLPQTQFTNINLKKIKLNFEEFFPEKITHTYFLELKNEKIWIIDKESNVYNLNINSVVQNKNEEKLDLTKIKTNLPKVTVLDTFLHENELFVYFSQTIDGCKTINISSAKINNKNLKFKKIFDSDECQKNEIQLGRLVYYEHQDEPGLLVATNFFVRDQPKKYLSQNDDSIFGKIIFINLKNSEKIIFSKGHRAPQGLYVENDLIISTEHGPKGGDEINRIIFGENYGWPIASYGDYYMEKDTTSSNIYSKKPHYLKNHKLYGFKEPIFSFIPAIGISEIIRLPNNFSSHFIDNFIVTSLNGKSLFRIKFDEEYSKILFSEKIFIGKRIRDIKYHNQTKTILLGLEYNGEIGVLSR